MEARKAAFEDEDNAKDSKSEDNGEANVPKKGRRTRLSAVLEKLEQMEKEKVISKKKELVKVAEEALRKAIENCFIDFLDSL